jgi:hypothetical protein
MGFGKANQHACIYKLLRLHKNKTIGMCQLYPPTVMVRACTCAAPGLEELLGLARLEESSVRWSPASKTSSRAQDL